MLISCTSSLASLTRTVWMNNHTHLPSGFELWRCHREIYGRVVDYDVELSGLSFSSSFLGIFRLLCRCWVKRESRGTQKSHYGIGAWSKKRMRSLFLVWILIHEIQSRSTCKRSETYRAFCERSFHRTSFSLLSMGNAVLFSFRTESKCEAAKTLSPFPLQGLDLCSISNRSESDGESVKTSFCWLFSQSSL